MKLWRSSAVQREEGNSTEKASSARGKSTALWQGALWDRRLSKPLLTWSLVGTCVAEKAACDEEGLRLVALVKSLL